MPPVSPGSRRTANTPSSSGPHRRPDSLKWAHSRKCWKASITGPPCSCWRTRGSETNSRNNHPIRAGAILGTHNGTIYNADHLFGRLRLPRFAEVDSEIIFRLADRFAHESAIEPEGFKRALALCRGQMSAVLASRFAPWTVLVLKGNKPLSMFLHRKHRVVAYATEPEWLEYAVAGEKGWRSLETPPMTMLTFEHQDITDFRAETFRFTAQERRGGPIEATGNRRRVPA